MQKKLMLLRRWLGTYPGRIFLAILIFAAFTRFWRLGYPTGYYFDEVYHVITAKLMAANDPRAYEWWHAPIEPGTAIDWLHPPLAKLMQALSINLLGNTSFAWRASSALMGTLSIGLTYLLARRLKLSPSMSLLAMFLLTLDGLSLTLSRITMNDAHVTFFMLLATYFYLIWKEKQDGRWAAATAVAAALALASKWSGIFVVGFFLLDSIYNQLQLRGATIPPKKVLQLFFFIIIALPTIYLASYSQMFLQGKGWQHFKELHQQIFWYQTNLKATHPYQSTPLQWVAALRPLYAYTEASPPGKMANIYFSANPLLSWAGVGAIFFLVINVLAQAMQKASVLRQALKKSPEKAGSFLQNAWKQAEALYPLQDAEIVTLLAYLSTWIVWLQSPRIMFFYHYTPAMPFLAILTAIGLSKLWQKQGLWRLASLALLGAITLNFLIFFPNWTAITVPSEPFSSLYFALPSWR